MESVMKRTTATGFLSTCAISLALFSSCTSVEPNTLTPEEIADGWQLLFDGKTLNGWKDYNGTTLTQPWHVVDGCIQAKGDGSDASGYIVTDKQYENFELSWDWKLSKGGNSGMLYHVVERPQFAVPYVTGPEYQLIDEPNFPEPLEFERIKLKLKGAWVLISGTNNGWPIDRTVCGNDRYDPG